MINVQNIDDNECFKWCLIRYLNPADRNPVKPTKADKDFAKKSDFKDIKFPVKVRDIHKIEKNNCIGISVFGYENKEIYTKCIKKCCEENHVSFIEKKGKGHYNFIKYFNTSMYNHTLHRKKIFWSL